MHILLTTDNCPRCAHVLPGLEQAEIECHVVDAATMVQSDHWREWSLALVAAELALLGAWPDMALPILAEVDGDSVTCRDYAAICEMLDIAPLQCAGGVCQIGGAK